MLCYLAILDDEAKRSEFETLYEKSDLGKV